MLKIKMRCREPRGCHYYVTWLYNKEVGQSDQRGVRNSKEATSLHSRKYWENPAIKKTKTPGIPTSNTNDCGPCESWSPS